MRTLALAILLSFPAAAAGDSLWTQLATADAVVVGAVTQVDGETARLGVQQTLKGTARDPLLVSTLTGGHLVAPNLRVGSRAVFVLRRAKPPAKTAGGVTLPKDPTTPVLASRMATLFLLGDDDVAVLGLLDEALRAQKGGLPMPGGWPVRLLRLAPTRDAALSLLETNLPPSDEARAAAAALVLSGDFDGPYTVVNLARWLRLAGPVHDVDVDAAALGILERSRARPEKAWRSLEHLALSEVTARVETALPSALAEENRRRLKRLAETR